MPFVSEKAKEMQKQIEAETLADKFRIEGRNRQADRQNATRVQNPIIRNDRRKNGPEDTRRG